MADNTAQTGSATIAADDVTSLNGGASSGVLVQRVKVGYGDDGSHRDTSMAFPLPTQVVASGGLATVAGTITAAGTNTPGTPATTSTTGSVVANTSLAGNATFHVVATAFVGTLIFEGSVDGGLNYGPLMAIREDGSGSESSTAISTAAAFIRQYTVALPGLAYFRVRCSAFTSGTAAILIAPGPTLIEPTPSLGASNAQIGILGPSLNSIGYIGDQFAGNLAVTATSTAGATVTLTLPAVAGVKHEIIHLAITLYSSVARTGAAAPWVVTSTNLNGLAWTFSTAGAVGTNETQVIALTTPLKSAAVNTATTIVCPAATGGIWRVNAVYFTAL